MEHRGSFITGYTAVVLLFASGRTQHHSSFSLYNFCVIQLFTGYMLMTPEVLVDFQLHINRVRIRIFENPPRRIFCVCFLIVFLRQDQQAKRAIGLLIDLSSFVFGLFCTFF